jgi:phage terminase large subunit GpA-like protein
MKIFFLQLLSEHKEIKLSRGVRTTVWKRIRDRNEGLDLAVMILCLLDVYRSQIDQMSGPQIVQENGERPAEQPEPRRPKWGAIYQAPLPTDPWQAVPNNRPPPDKRSPFGVVNKPIQW